MTLNAGWSKTILDRLAIVCPITNTERSFPFHVPIPEDAKLTGFIMVKPQGAHLCRRSGTKEMP
jgi:mRNA-degrading endonuclease toxin of MazEF toxin-antitoxin module